MITADPSASADEVLRTAKEQFAVLEERARIARDLHDHVIQRLFGTGLGLVALAAIDPEHAEALERHIAEIDAAIADIRTAVFTLTTRPHSTSARHRLLDIVTDLTPNLATPPRMFSGPIDLVLTGGRADDVIAVVREALTNVSRHARARTAIVDIAVSGAEVTVTVDDDGVGVEMGFVASVSSLSSGLMPSTVMGMISPPLLMALLAVLTGAFVVILFTCTGRGNPNLTVPELASPVSRGTSRTAASR